MRRLVTSDVASPGWVIADPIMVTFAKGATKVLS
jgi:hypothetical protein